MKIKKPELLLPAGSLEKLKVAFHFGADAVYLGGKSFSLRANATNFSHDDIKEAVALAKKLKKKTYVTLNIYAHNRDLEQLKEEIIFLDKVGIDAVLVSDIGVLSLVKEVAPKLPIHISTQANTTNYKAVQMYKSLGASRVVLARELSIKEISEIHNNCDIELETFVHGAMCVGMSGRCLLSEYFTNRNANLGACSQPCRWEYKLQRFEKEEDSSVFVEEDSRGTYFFNSKDLQLIDRLKELLNAGVYSLKVEGRMKSEFYLATVALAYRRAIDDIVQYGKIRDIDELKKELSSIAHRAYTEAYAEGDNKKTIYPDGGQIEEEQIFIARVIGFENGRALLEMRNRFFENDEVSVLSPSECCYKKFKIEDIQNDKGEHVTDAKLVQATYSIKPPFRLEEGDIIRRQK